MMPSTLSNSQSSKIQRNDQKNENFAILQWKEFSNLFSTLLPTRPPGFSSDVKICGRFSLLYTAQQAATILTQASTDPIQIVEILLISRGGLTTSYWPPDSTFVWLDCRVYRYLPALFAEFRSHSTFIKETIDKGRSVEFLIGSGPHRSG